jgi:hypothetical protein
MKILLNLGTTICLIISLGLVSIKESIHNFCNKSATVTVKMKTSYIIWPYLIFKNDTKDLCLFSKNSVFLKATKTQLCAIKTYLFVFCKRFVMKIHNWSKLCIGVYGRKFEKMSNYVLWTPILLWELLCINHPSIVLNCQMVFSGTIFWQRSSLSRHISQIERNYLFFHKG